jgi:hypothetical protein
MASAAMSMTEKRDPHPHLPLTCSAACVYSAGHFPPGIHSVRSTSRADHRFPTSAPPSGTARSGSCIWGRRAGRLRLVRARPSAAHCGHVCHIPRAEPSRGGCGEQSRRLSRPLAEAGQFPQHLRASPAALIASPRRAAITARAVTSQALASGSSSSLITHRVSARRRFQKLSIAMSALPALPAAEILR